MLKSVVMAYHFIGPDGPTDKQLLFSKVGVTALVAEVVKPTIPNKSCSNQKMNATLLFQF